MNLIVHIIFIPLFWFGLIQTFWGASLLDASAFIGLAAILVSFLAQGIGHKSEPEQPTPFLGPADFFSRFLFEQIITFPRFVLSGKWLKALAK